MHSDPSKPRPGDVLKAFSLGLEFENKLIELQTEPERSLYLTPSEKDLKHMQTVTSSVDKRNLLGLGRDSPRCKDSKHSDCSKEREVIQSLSPDSTCEEDSTVPTKEMDRCAKLSLDASQSIETLVKKVM